MNETTVNSLTDAFAQVFGPVTFQLPASPASHEDEDTLRRSFGTLSASARREQRRPAATVTDELGYDRRGTYYATADGRWSA